MSVDDQKENSPHPLQIPSKQEIDIYPSSDDEEKVRTKKVKKQKTSSSAVDKSRKSSTLPKATSTSTLKSGGTTTPKGSVRSRKTSKTKTTRASSLFGAELPNPQPAPPMPIASYTQTVEATPMLSPHKTLRRVKTTNFPRAMSRRISFGSLAAPVEEELDHNGAGLDTAFQLR